MYAKILIILVLAVLCTGCTDPVLPDPYEFGNVTPGAPALQKSWDSETQTITISTLDDTPRLTIRKISAVPDLCTFEEVLEINSFVNYDLNKLKDFRTRWYKHKGQHDITKVEWFILKNESYDITVNDYETIQVEETHYYNVTVNQTVLTGNHSEIRYHDIWKSFSPVGKSIHAGQTYNVKIVYHKKPELGDVRIQTIPMFTGVECEELTWWNSSWNYRRNITINHSQVDAVMTNFPTMVSITQLGLNADGNDTRITDSSDNQVARDIEFYNQTSGELVFFFNGTSISNTADTSFWMYYNNTEASEPTADSMYGSQAVYGAGYDAVYHMNGLIDSTSNGRTCTIVGTVTQSEGDYGKEYDFQGSTDYMHAPTGIIAFPFTIMNRMKLDTVSSYMPFITLNDASDAAVYYGARADGASPQNYRIDARGNGIGEVTASTTLDVSTSEYVTMHAVYASATDRKLYINGAVEATSTGSVTFDPDVDKFLVGQLRITSPVTNTLDGVVSEARSSSAARSDNYISTNHNNLNNPTAAGVAPFFTSFGAEESASIITAYTPSTPLSKTTGDSQLFTVNTSENSQCRWYINGSLKQTNSTGATRHEYLNSSLEGGYWNFTATANTTDMTSSQTWWVTVTSADEFEQDMYAGRWMYATYLDGSNTNLSEFFTDLAPYYLSFYNATDKKTYNYKSGRWEKYADNIIKPGEAAILRYTSNITKVRTNASGTFGFTLQTGLNHIGHSHNGTRTLSWYNTTIASSNLVTIEHQNTENGTISTFTYGSADNGSVEVLQGFGVEVNVSSDTVISGL